MKEVTFLGMQNCHDNRQNQALLGKLSRYIFDLLFAWEIIFFRLLPQFWEQILNHDFSRLKFKLLITILYAILLLQLELLVRV